MFNLPKLNKTKNPEFNLIRVGLYLGVGGILDPVINRIYRDIEFKRYGITLSSVKSFEDPGDGESVFTFVEFEAIITLNEHTEPQLRTIYEQLKDVYSDANNVSDFSSKLVLFNLILNLQIQINFGALDRFVMVGDSESAAIVRDDGIDIRVEFGDTITDTILPFHQEIKSIKDWVVMDLPENLIEITDDVIM